MPGALIFGVYSRPRAAAGHRPRPAAAARRAHAAAIPLRARASGARLEPAGRAGVAAGRGDRGGGRARVLLYLFSIPFGAGRLRHGRPEAAGLGGAARRAVAAARTRSSIGVFLAGIVIVVLLAMRRITLKTFIPFGPFLIIGARWAILVLEAPPPGQDDPARRGHPASAEGARDRGAVERELLPEGLAVLGEDAAVVRGAVDDQDHDAGQRVVALLERDAARLRLEVVEPRLGLDRGALAASWPLDPAVPCALIAGDRERDLSPQDERRGEDPLEPVEALSDGRSRGPLSAGCYVIAGFRPTARPARHTCSMVGLASCPRSMRRTATPRGPRVAPPHADRGRARGGRRGSRSRPWPRGHGSARPRDPRLAACRS